MSRPSVRTVIAATIGGIAHLSILEALFRTLDHVPEVLWPLASIENAVPVFAFGFLTVLVAAHTRLLSPVIGIAGLLGWATYRDVTTPMPEWSELGGYLVVDGPVFLTRYDGAWYVWVSLFIVAASVEFGLRRRYGFGDARLRNLPELPSNRRHASIVSAAVGAVFGLAVLTWAAGIGVNPTEILPVLLVTTSAAAAVPVGAALYKGLLTPAICFSIFVIPPLLRQAFTASEGGPVFLLLLGPMAIAFAIVGLVEYLIRTRLNGRFGNSIAVLNAT